MAVYAPAIILEKTVSIKITYDGLKVSFFNKDGDIIFITFGQSYEDVVGLDKVKGFILD